MTVALALSVVCKLLEIDSNAPSAVWARDIPSPAFRIATDNPLICEEKRVEIAKPAASSFALLILSPDDSRSNEVLVSGL